MTTPGKPLTRARSAWEPVRDVEILGVVEGAWARRVGDGRLLVIVGREPQW